MKIFAKTKNLWKKIILIFTIFATVTVVSPKPVQASHIPGGELMEPICSFLVGVGDGIMDAIHSALIHQGQTLIRANVESSWKDIFKTILKVVVCFVVIAALMYITAGGAATIIAPIAALGKIGVVAATAVTGLGYFVGGGVGIAASVWIFNSGLWGNDDVVLPLYSITPEEIFKNDEVLPLFSVNFFNADENEVIFYEMSTEESDSKNTADVGHGMPSADAQKAQQMQNRQSKGVIHTLSYDLSKFVFGAYKALRMIAIVGMMSVLVYIGIRIVISSGAPQKAKYKQMLGDWLVGMILLFTMHYIMYFSNLFVDQISRLLNNTNPSLYALEFEDGNGKIKEKLKDSGFDFQDIGSPSNAQVNIDALRNQRKVSTYKGDDGKDYIEWYTNLMGLIRARLNYNAEGENIAYVGYTIMFLVMVIYTIVFAWTYIKRVIYMAFLTLIAPLVALTYPIDKINDGSAQGFNYWFKEYMFNLLLQPMHLLIYTILVSAALELSLTNIVYGLVALGFIASAEKIVRKMFNFQKADTPGVLAGPAGAAMTMAGMRWLLGHGPHGPNGPKRDGPTKSDNSGNRIREAENKSSMRNLMSGVIKDKAPTEGNKENNIQNQDENNSNLVGPDYEKQDYNNLTPGSLADTEQSNNSGDTDNSDNSDFNQHNNSAQINTRNIPLNESAANSNENPIENWENEARNSGEYSDWAFEQNNEGPTGQIQDGGTIRQVEDIGITDKIKNGIKNTKVVKGISNKANSALEAANNNKVIKGIKNNNIARGTGRALRGAGRIVKDNAKAIQSDKGKIGNIAKVAAGATAGMIGVAAGVASGGPEKVVQYAAGGAAAGAKLGGGAAGSIGENVSKTKESFQRGRLGDKEYENRQRQKQNKKELNKKETVSAVAEGLGISKAEAKEIINTNGVKYAENGFSDPRDIVNLEKLQRDKKIEYKNNKGTQVSRKYTPEESMAVLKTYKRFSNNIGKETEVKKRLQQDYTWMDSEMVDITYKGITDMSSIINE